jgi:hypothetical protein
MVTFFRTDKMKRLLIVYWLLVPLLFGVYLLSFAAVKTVSVSTIFSTIPTITLTTIVVLLLLFQLYGLSILGDSSGCRHSLLGVYLKFSMIQQLFTVNIPGFLLCLFFYRSLSDSKENSTLSKQVRWLSYMLMVMVGLLTILVTWIRLSL